MHMALCHGPVNSINKIYVGERPLTFVPVAYNGINSIVTRVIDNNYLFGGEKKEGGIEGPIDIMFGAADQGQNAYLLEQLGDPLPSFRGITSVVLNQCYVSAMSPYPKAWWFEITRIPGNDLVDEWYPEKSEPTTGSANAAHIVREALVNSDWGLGYPAVAIDEDSFMAVADTLFDEGFGVSYILSTQGATEEFIQDVLRTVNGVLFTDRSTGNFTLKLVRDDYVVGDLLVLDESNIIEYSSFQRPQPGEIVNEVTLTYRRSEDSEDTSITFQNLASVTAQGGVISQALKFPGIDSDDIATLVGMRELRQYSTPLAQVTFTANRQAWDLNPGEAFVFSWAERGISQLVMRAIKIDYGDLTDGQIQISAIEDIFGLPEATYIQPQESLWVDPVTTATALQPEEVYEFEVPYYILATNFEPADLQAVAEDTGYLMAIADFPFFVSPSFELWTTLDDTLPYTGYDFKVSGTYCYRLELVNGISETDNEIDIDIGSFPGGFITDVELNSLCIIGDSEDEEEMAIFSSYNTGTNTIQLKRGALDTLPKSHAARTSIWFFEDKWAFDNTQYIDGDQVVLKLLPQTGIDILDIDATSFSIVDMEGRQYRPSPPSYINLTDQGAIPANRFFPASIRGQFIINWRRTNRISQTVVNNPPYFYGSDDIDTEDGLEWRLSLYDETVVESPTTPTVVIDLLPGTVTYTWTTEEADSGLTGRLNNQVRVRLRAIRTEDTTEIESKEVFDLTVDRRGWTYQWGKYWDGDE
jgi:hypothetical protein